MLSADHLRDDRQGLQWQLRGSCRAEDSELFFGEEDEGLVSRWTREAVAKDICARCPVLRPCRAYALTTRQTHGVWGGLSESDRKDLWAIGSRRAARRIVTGVPRLIRSLLLAMVRPSTVLPARRPAADPS